jgi:hypothetical protein
VFSDHGIHGGLFFSFSAAGKIEHSMYAALMNQKHTEVLFSNHIAQALNEHSRTSLSPAGASATG